MSEFEVSLDKMREVERSLMAEFKRGLEKEGDDVKVKMLLTHVHSFPSDETGEYLFVDFGGTNLRVGRISELQTRHHGLYSQSTRHTIVLLQNFHVITHVSHVASYLRLAVPLVANLDSACS